MTHWARIRCKPNVLLLPKTKPIYAVAKFGLNKPNSEKVIRFFANFRIIYYLCTQNNNYHGCNV